MMINLISDFQNVAIESTVERELKSTSENVNVKFFFEAYFSVGWVNDPWLSRPDGSLKFFCLFEIKTGLI